MADITIAHSRYHERAIVNGNSGSGSNWVYKNWGENPVTIRVDYDDAKELKERIEADGLTVSLV